MATRASRSRDKPHKRSLPNSPSKSRSRSRHRQRKSNRHKPGTNKNNTNNDIKNNNNNNNNVCVTDDLIGLYEPSSKIKQELFDLLRNDRQEYMNKKKEAHNNISTILNSMSVKQEQRFECWNRSVIPKKIVKSIMNNALNRNAANVSKKKSNIDDKSVIVMQALAKCLVMELVNKSRQIQKETIHNYLNNNSNKHSIKENDINQNNQNNKMELEIPPLAEYESNKNNNSEENIMEQKEQKEQNSNNDNLISIDILNEVSDKEKRRENVDNDCDTDNELNKSNELDEQCVFGAIRPTHIREALRQLQRDKSSFFHNKTYLFGADQ